MLLNFVSFKFFEDYGEAEPPPTIRVMGSDVIDDIFRKADIIGFIGLWFPNVLFYDLGIFNTIFLILLHLSLVLSFIFFNFIQVFK